MAPFPLCSISQDCQIPRMLSILSRATEAEDQLRTQWQSPSDIFSLLLILGPDVIRQALAQLTGPRFVPIAFSFGWVAYSVNALLDVAGGKRQKYMARKLSS